MTESQPLTTEQLLQMYRHVKGLVSILESMLIERGAINPISRYSSQTAYSVTSTIKVSD